MSSAFAMSDETLVHIDESPAPEPRVSLGDLMLIEDESSELPTVVSPMNQTMELVVAPSLVLPPVMSAAKQSTMQLVVDEPRSERCIRWLGDYQLLSRVDGQHATFLARKGGRGPHVLLEAMPERATPGEAPRLTAVSSALLTPVLDAGEADGHHYIVTRPPEGNRIAGVLGAMRSQGREPSAELIGAVLIVAASAAKSAQEADVPFDLDLSRAYVSATGALEFSGVGLRSDTSFAQHVGEILRVELGLDEAECSLPIEQQRELRNVISGLDPQTDPASIQTHLARAIPGALSVGPTHLAALTGGGWTAPEMSVLTHERTEPTWSRERVAKIVLATVAVLLLLVALSTIGGSAPDPSLVEVVPFPT